MSATSSFSRRPRVLQCVTHLALGGAERVALTLMESLRDEFDFELFAVRGLGDGEVGRAIAREVAALDVPLHLGARIPMRFGGMLTGAFGMARVLRSARPDIIHLHTEIPEASYAAMVALCPRRRSTPLVRTVHNTVFWEFWRRMGRWCDRRMQDCHVAGVSSGATAAFLRLRNESGARPPSQPPVTIYNGVRTLRVTNELASRRGHTGPVQIVFGGRFEDQKGTDLLPQILAQVRPPTPRGAHLVIYGSGAHESLLRVLAENPPAGWSVEVRPPSPDFAKRLGDFDVAIMPSRYEGLGLVAVEAFLAGTPVIATDAVGLLEALPPSYPWIAHAGDAASFAAVLQRVLDHPAQWPEVAEAGRAFARTRFDVNAMADGYRTLYRRVLGKAAP